MEHTEADPRLPNADLPEMKHEVNRFDEEEVWISLTCSSINSLRQQLGCIDNAMEIRSVNTLRWDGVMVEQVPAMDRECAW